MIKKIIVRYKKLILYVLIGGCSAALDLALFLLLYNAAHINPLIATAISTSVGITTSFIGNVLFNFKVRDRLHHRYVLFYSVGLTGLALSISIIYLLHTILGLSANISKLASIPIVVLVQYYLNSRFSLAQKLSSLRQLEVYLNPGRDIKIAANYLRQNYVYILFGLPIAMLLIVYLIKVARFGISYDESYNLQVAVNLAQHHEYATNGTVFNGIAQLFDPNISTGPTLLVPIAIIFKFVGIGVTQYRILSAAIYLSLAVSIYTLILFLSRKRLLAFTFGTVCILLLLATDISGGFIYSISAIGEPLCALLLIIAALLIGKNSVKSAGLFIGLAILTKLIAFFALPALCVVLILLWRRKTIAMVDALLSLIFVAIPSICFEIYRFLALGHNPARYIANIKQFIAFFKSGGSGLASSSTISRPSIGVRILSLVDSVQPEYRIIVVLSLMLLASFVLVVIFLYATQKNKQSLLQNLSPNAAWVFLATSGLLWLTWWLSIASVAYYRHIWVGLILLLLAISVAIIKVCEAALISRSRYWHVMNIAAYTLLTCAVAFVVIHANSTEFISLKSQEEDAQKISAILGTRPMYVFGWWQNPEVQFLSQRPGLPSTTLHGKGWVIMGRLEKDLDPTEYNSELKTCDSLLPISERYTACLYKGDN